MRDRRPKLLLDAIAAMDNARQFLGQASLVDYEANAMLRSAVERQLEILGEACARLGKEHPSLFADLPATRLAVGLRNRIIHGYDAIDDEMVYLTVTQDLSGLAADLKGLLSIIDPSAPSTPQASDRC